MSNIIVLGSKYCGQNKPTDLLVDTNVFIELIDDKSCNGDDATHFLVESSKNATNLFITTNIIEELHHQLELYHIRSIATKNGIDLSQYNYRYGYKRLATDLKALKPEYYKEVSGLVKANIDDIQRMTTTLTYDNHDDIMSKVRDLKYKYEGCIETSDAIDLVLANEHEINTIVTGDNGFIPINRINIIALAKGKYKRYVGNTANFEPWKDILLEGSEP